MIILKSFVTILHFLSNLQDAVTAVIVFLLHQQKGFVTVRAMPIFCVYRLQCIVEGKNVLQSRKCNNYLNLIFLFYSISKKDEITAKHAYFFQSISEPGLEKPLFRCPLELPFKDHFSK